MASQDAGQGQSETFAYDAAANLLDGPQAGIGLVRHNRLLTYQDKRYRYDGFGRLIEKRSSRRGIQHFSYDAEHRLIQVRSQHGGRQRVLNMRYDPLGRRVEKSEHDDQGNLLDQTRFAWDGLRLLQEHRYSQTSLYLYVEDSHEPLARVDGTGLHQQVRYYHNDLNGLPEQLTDDSGEAVWQARYQVWGNTLQEVREAHFIEEQNLRFQGQYLDRETGLHYNTFRFYDPDIGRFTQPDPVGLEGGLNLYYYALNPFTWLDPLGLTSCGTPRKSANPSKVINDLKAFSGRRFRFGGNTFKLDKSGMKHILERHHPKYWDGSVKARQSFLSPKLSIKDVSNVVRDVMRQNRGVLVGKGTVGKYQISGTSGGVEYVVGLNNGRVGQLYPK